METAWLYEDGDWEEIDNPLPDLTQETIRTFGYESTPTAIFGASGETPGLTIEVYPGHAGERRLPYGFLVLVPALTSQPIFAATLPDVLELLGQLVPLVGAATG